MKAARREGRGGEGPLRIPWLYFRVGVPNEFQYRANLFVQLLRSAVSVGTALAVLALVYSHTDDLNGWRPSEPLVVMGIQILLGGAIRTSIQPNMERLMEDVRDGRLDFGSASASRSSCRSPSP